jgi:endoglucanase
MRKRTSLSARAAAAVAGLALATAAVVGLFASSATASAAADRTEVGVAADRTEVGLVAAENTCQVSYAITDEWAHGFNAVVTVYNNGPQINNWNLTWTFPGPQQVNGVWEALFQQDGATVSVTGDPHNFNLLADSSVTFGLNVSGPPATPAEFVLNGTVCS